MLAQCLHQKRSRRIKARGNGGSAAAELPAVLWLLICLLIFPLLDLCAIGLRVAVISYITHRCCTLSARASSFETPIGTSSPAKDVSSGVATTLTRTFAGVYLDNVNTQILATDVRTRTRSFFDRALPRPANTSDNTYQINVTVTARVDPLVTVPYFPVKVPGLTGPILITCSDRQFAECPQGLNI